MENRPASLRQSTSSSGKRRAASACGAISRISSATGATSSLALRVSLAGIVAIMRTPFIASTASTPHVAQPTRGSNRVHPGNLGNHWSGLTAPREGNPSAYSLLYEMVRQRYRCRLRPVACAEFGVDVRDVPFDGRNGHDQLRGDLLRGVAADEQPQHL